MKQIKKKFNIEIRKADGMQGFAAYQIGSARQRKVVVLLNVYATLACCLENDISFKEMLAEDLMHEFGHALQEFFELEFTEEFVEKVTESYREKYGDKSYIEAHGEQNLPDIKEAIDNQEPQITYTAGTKPGHIQVSTRTGVKVS